MPVTFHPRRKPDKVTARMTAFRPGASPPPVLTRMCMDPTPYRGLTLPATGRGDYSMFLEGFGGAERPRSSGRFAQCGDQHGSARVGGRHDAEVHTVHVTEHPGVERLLGCAIRGDRPFLHDDDVVAVRRR